MTTHKEGPTMPNQAALAYEILEQASTRPDKTVWVQGSNFYAARRLVAAGHGTMTQTKARRGWFTARAGCTLTPCSHPCTRLQSCLKCHDVTHTHTVSA